MIFNCAIPLPVFIIPNMHIYETTTEETELEGSLGALTAGWQHLEGAVSCPRSLQPNFSPRPPPIQKAGACDSWEQGVSSTTPKAFSSPFFIIPLGCLI